MSQDFSQLFEQDRAHFMHPSTHAHGRRTLLPRLLGHDGAVLKRLEPRRPPLRLAWAA